MIHGMLVINISAFNGNNCCCYAYGWCSFDLSSVSHSGQLIKEQMGVATDKADSVSAYWSSFMVPPSTVNPSERSLAPFTQAEFERYAAVSKSPNYWASYMFLRYLRNETRPAWEAAQGRIVQRLTTDCPTFPFVMCPYNRNTTFSFPVTPRYCTLSPHRHHSLLFTLVVMS